jgi:hypothetical protein
MTTKEVKDAAFQAHLRAEAAARELERVPWDIDCPEGVSCQFGDEAFIFHAKKKRHLIFDLLPKSAEARKVTHTWSVWNGSTYLGEIRWFAHWRRYVFYPDKDTLFDPGCLAELGAFCLEQSKMRRMERQKEK